MHIRLLSITHKSPPAWIQAGYAEYAKRLSPMCKLELIEIAAEKRPAHADLQRIKEKEGEKICATIKPQHVVIALEITGSLWSTEELSRQLSTWQDSGQSLDLLIGGPEGLSAACLKTADKHWSLSPLTFPHLFVRLIVSEQLYRVFSILKNHPYHR
jgi:23S rRNA (pseudouridine1915-N3)-methyltransferase